MFQTIGAFFKLVLFFLNLKSESNKKKAKEKAEIGKEIVDALAETNKARRISAVNSVIGRLRK
jgi:hypothetical protein